MAISADSKMRWQSVQGQLAAFVLPVFILGVAVWVGLQARTGTAELAKKEGDWRRAADQLATAQQQFRIPTSTESAALIAESSRMGALGVPPSERVSLMEFLANLAEASTLANVRVNFGTSDTTYAPPRSIAGESINKAPYGLSLDFTGSFAGLVQFVSNLPPSVTISRLGAGRHGDETEYHVFLSVYELPNVDKGG